MPRQSKPKAVSVDRLPFVATGTVDPRSLADAIADRVIEAISEIRRDRGLPPLK